MQIFLVKMTINTVLPRYELVIAETMSEVSQILEPGWSDCSSFEVMPLGHEISISKYGEPQASTNVALDQRLRLSRVLTTEDLKDLINMGAAGT